MSHNLFFLLVTSIFLTDGKSEGGAKRKLGRTKKGLKKQVKPKKLDQIMSKEVQKQLTKSINKNIEEHCLSHAGKAGTSLKIVKNSEKTAEGGKNK